MRIAFLVLFIFSCLTGLSQSVLETKFNYQADNLSVEDVLLQLSEKANCNISFNSDYFKEDQRISIPLQYNTLSFFLKTALKNTDYTFREDGNSIYLVAVHVPIYTISGFVEDSLSGERLVSATVFDKQSGKGTITNEYGFFSLSIPKGGAILNVSYLGFQSKDYQISIGKNLALNIGLNASTTLEEIVVSDSKIQATSDIGQFDASSLRQLSQFSTLAGEPDVFRYFQNLAGVESGSDGFGGMQVRGGADNQNLVFLDGVPVYNPSHSLGLFSIFNTQTIKSAKLYKGGFPARYSGRLSSVVDVRTREGSLKKFHAGINIGTLATSLFAEGPIQKEKTGFLLSLRRTHIDPIINTAVSSRRADNIEGTTTYYFYDANIKLHHHLSDKDRLYLSFYKGNDAITDNSELEDEDEDEDEDDCDDCPEKVELSEQSSYLNYDWGNTILAFRWNHIPNNKLFFNTTFTYSEFGFMSDFRSSDYFIPSTSSNIEEGDFSDVTLYSFRSNIKDLGLRLDVDFIPNPQHTIKMGTGFLVRNFKPTVLSRQFERESVVDLETEELEEDTTLINTNIVATELNAYFEDDWVINDKWSIHYGIHATAFITTSNIFPSFQPRLSVQYQATNSFKLQWSINRMQQFLHVLQSSNTRIPNDLWVPSTENAKPQFSWQTDIGFKWQLSKDISWSIEGYYKQLNRLIAYREDTDFLLNEPTQERFDWEEEIATGDGWAYGLESSLEKKIGKTKGWLNYTLAWSERQFDNINNGLKFPARFSRRHSLNLGINQAIKSNIHLLVIWRYGSGQWTNLPTIAASSTESVLDIFQPVSTINNTGVNEFQLRASHRLDVVVNINWSKARWQHSLSLGVYNAYARKNPILVYVEEQTPNTIQEVGLGWAIPSLRYELRF